MHHDEQFILIQLLRRMIANEKLTPLDLTRLVLLYTLRYERNTSNNIKGLRTDLQRRGVNDIYLQVCSGFLIRWIIC